MVHPFKFYTLSLLGLLICIADLHSCLLHRFLESEAWPRTRLHRISATCTLSFVSISNRQPTLALRAPTTKHLPMKCLATTILLCLRPLQLLRIVALTVVPATIGSAAMAVEVLAFGCWA